MFFDILKVGAVSCFSPLQSVLTITIFTHMLARFGTEILAGYGIGARLEFMLTSIAFAIGIASVPMVGMAIGARRVARARRIAWIAGCVAFVSVGAGRHRDRDLSRSLGRHLHRRCRRARRQPAISVDRGADVRLHRAFDLDVFFLAGRGEGSGTGAGANRAAGVRGRRRLVAVDPRRHAGGFLRAGRGFDGGARHAVRRKRHPDPMGTEARAPSWARARHYPGLATNARAASRTWLRSCRKFRSAGGAAQPAAARRTGSCWCWFRARPRSRAAGAWRWRRRAGRSCRRSRPLPARDDRAR